MCHAVGSVWTLAYNSYLFFSSQFGLVQGAMDSLHSGFITPSQNCQNAMEQSELLLGDVKKMYWS